MQIKHTRMSGPTGSSCVASLRGLWSFGGEFVMAKRFNLVWWSCRTEPRLTPASNRRSTVTACHPPAAGGMVLVNHHLICFERHIRKPPSLITANLQTKKGVHLLNTLLFANTLIVPRCICFCPAALEAAGEEIIAAPESHRPKQFQDAPGALLHPCEGAVPISLLPSDLASSAVFFHTKIKQQDPQTLI